MPHPLCSCGLSLVFPAKYAAKVWGGDSDTNVKSAQRGPWGSAMGDAVVKEEGRWHAVAHSKSASQKIEDSAAGDVQAEVVQFTGRSGGNYGVKCWAVINKQQPNISSSADVLLGKHDVE